jgi:hypothetical protein
MVALILTLFIAISWYEQAESEVAQRANFQVASPGTVEKLNRNDSQAIADDTANSNDQVDPMVFDQTSELAEGKQSPGTQKNTEILATLHQRSATELATLAIGVADYFEEELLGFDDLYHFTDRLLRIEQNASDDLLHSEPAIYGEISFANSESVGMGELWERNDFSSDDSRIVAHMPEINPDVLGRKALVSWSRIEDGEILLLNTMAMDPELSRNNVWLESPTGWEPGNYRVAIYSGDEQLNLLSSGQFQVLPSTPGQSEY